MNTDVNNSAHRRDSEEYDEDTDHQRDNSVPMPKRNNKYYAQSPPNYYNNPWAHSNFGHAPPVNFWPGYPVEGNRQVYYDRYAPVGNYPPPPIAHGGYAPLGNYPPPPVAHGGYANVRNYPPSPSAHSSNPFSVGHIPQQP